MSGLEQAEKLMQKIEEAFDKVDDPVDIEIALQIAQVTALVFQAEQLKRIADRLEAISELEDGYGYLQIFKIEA